MGIDWANEPYVRLFKRETDDDLILSWEARAVWHEFLKKCDRSGLIETRRGVRGMADQVRIPLEVVERALAELLEDGRIRSVPNAGFIAPNYMEANDTPRSDRARQIESRLRRKLNALHDTPVTNGHAESREVTHIISDTDHTKDSPAPSEPPASPPSDLFGGAPEDKPDKTKRRCRIPDDWEPKPAERALAESLGLNCDTEAEEFKDFWLGDGRPKSNWDRTFRVRLRAQANRQGGSRFHRQSEPRRIEDL